MTTAGTAGIESAERLRVPIVAALAALGACVAASAALVIAAGAGPPGMTAGGEDTAAAAIDHGKLPRARPDTGQRGSATVHGAQWLTTDRRKGGRRSTTFRLIEGRLAIDDFTNKGRRRGAIIALGAPNSTG